MLVIKGIGLNIEYKYSLPNKSTARCPEQFVGSDDEGNLYLVVYAGTEIQKFYAERAVEYQQEFQNLKLSGMRLNLPLFAGRLEDGYYVIYKYYIKYKEATDIYTCKWLNEYYEQCEEHQVTNDLINCIEKEFLACWPKSFHEEIEKLNGFTKFHEELKKYEVLKLCFQHGDIAPNNVLWINGTYPFLMDFEFCQRNQPVGFDLYDFHLVTDRKYDDVPYLELNRIKEELQNTINQMIDKECVPIICEDSNIGNSAVVSHWADDLIYNRPDLYDADATKIVYIKYRKAFYKMYYTVHGHKASLKVWLRKIPATVIESTVDYIFRQEKAVLKIDVKNAVINCRNELAFDNNWVIFLPSKPEEITNRMSKKSRYNFKREKRMLEEAEGQLSFDSYEIDIPEDLISLYFNWKHNTHGVVYHLSEKEYIKKYHITGAMTLKAGEKLVSILFFCKNKRTIYLENLSYDSVYAAFSPGIILYEKFLERMTQMGSEVVFLGNGNQLYKSRFNGQEYIVYSGAVYRSKFFRWLNKIEKKILRR